MAKRTQRRRSRGTGSITKQVSGIYAYYWTDANGKKHKKSLRTRNLEDAKAEAAKYERGVQAKDRADVIHEAAKARQLIREQQLPLNEAWKAYQATNPTCSEGTKGNHKRHLDNFVEWLTESYPAINSFTQVSEDIAVEYGENLWAKGISAATFNYHRASLLAITNAIGRKYGIDRNPWNAVERQSDEQQTRRVMSTTEVNTLLENTGTDAELYTLLMLGCYAGMRLKDAALLRWHDISLAHRTIEYRPYKTRRRNKTATVPITADLLKALRNLDTSTEYILPRISDLYLNRYDHLKKSLLALIRTVSPDYDHEGTMQKQQTRRSTGFHGLRHYFCSTCANKGIPAAQLERMTGDQAKTLNRYYVKGEVDEEAVNGAFHKLTEGDKVRKQAHELIDTLPIEAVKELLKAAQDSQKTPKNKITA